jgi:hypothetical protein
VLLTPGNFHPEGGLYFTPSNTKHYSGSVPKGYDLARGDLVTVMTDLSPKTLILGRVAIIDESFSVLHNQRIGKLMIRASGGWDPTFLCHIMNGDGLRRRVIRESSGTTVRHTSPLRILSSRLARPPLVEQTAVCHLVALHEKREFEERESAAKLRHLKQGLMEDLLTGRIRVTNFLEPPP